MKRKILGLGVVLLLLFGIGAKDKPTVPSTFADDAQVMVEVPEEQMEAYFAAEGLDYFAYMDLESAGASLKPVILEARRRIILSSSWVADEIDGWVTNPDGTIAEVVPHFSEVFPSDWELPPMSPEEMEVDLEYYGISDS